MMPSGYKSGKDLYTLQVFFHFLFSWVSFERVC